MNTDCLTKEQRHKAMQAVKSTGSQIEQKLQKALWHRGYRYRKNYKRVVGKPDIAFVRLKVAVFVDSEFWWRKIERNMDRDNKVTEELQKEGWLVIRFWGEQVEKHLDQCIAVVSEALEQRRLHIKRN